MTHRIGRGGFSLLEVMLAMTIATVGVSYLYQGISISLVAEERQSFYDRCARFLNEELEQQLLLAAQSNSARSGSVPGYPPIDWTIAGTPSQEVQDLRRVTVAFTGRGEHSPPVAQLVTYYTPLLRTRKQPDGGK